MAVGAYQQCKYNVKNMKKWLCIFAFLTLVSILSLYEPMFNENCGLMLNWSGTKNFLKRKEQPFKKQP